MRIKITFANQFPNTLLPINTNNHLLKLINHLTFDYQRYLSSLAPGNSRCNRFDKYTFSQLIIPQRLVYNFKIGILSNEFYWFVSSPYYQFLGILAKELRERGRAKICDTHFNVTKVNFICSPEFKESEAQFTCLSPVAVYRRAFSRQTKEVNQVDNDYLLPGEADYLLTLKKDLLLKYNMVQSKKRKRIDFDLTFDERYLRKRNNKITKVITLESQLEHPEQVHGVLAPLHIKAEPDVLRLIYDLGLGQLNNLGFGMVEMVNAEHQFSQVYH